MLHRQHQRVEDVAALGRQRVVREHAPPGAQTVGGYKHLEHTQRAHRPHRPNGESPPGADGAARAGSPSSRAAGQLRRPHATPRPPAYCLKWADGGNSGGRTVCNLAEGGNSGARAVCDLAKGGNRGRTVCNLVSRRSRPARRSRLCRRRRRPRPQAPARDPSVCQGGDAHGCIERSVGA